MPKSPLSKIRPSQQSWALEPRLLFDGAGAVAADALVDAEAVVTETDAQAGTQEASTQPAALIVVDAAVAGYEALLSTLQGNFSVRIIGRDEAGIAAIGAELRQLSSAGQQPFDAVHILSHGSDGTAYLGSDVLNASNLTNNERGLMEWQSYLSESADIMLYGCDIAAGADGRFLINSIATLTGADVAASSDATGHSSLSGNWTLEYQTGPIEAALPFAESSLALFTELLAATGIEDSAAGISRVTSIGNIKGIS